jgi:hypothetical protein
MVAAGIFPALNDECDWCFSSGLGSPSHNSLLLGSPQPVSGVKYKLMLVSELRVGKNWQENYIVLLTLKI